MVNDLVSNGITKSDLFCDSLTLAVWYTTPASDPALQIQWHLNNFIVLWRTFGLPHEFDHLLHGFIVIR